MGVGLLRILDQKFLRIQVILIFDNATIVRNLVSDNLFNFWDKWVLIFVKLWVVCLAFQVLIFRQIINFLKMIIIPSMRFWIA